MTDADLAAIEARADAAYKMVVALCQPRGNPGSREWMMSIPAQPGNDPDIVIAVSISDIPALLAEVRRLRKALGPFAAIKRSSFCSHDDNEHYDVILSPQPLKGDFTGQDIERACAALNPGAVTTPTHGGTNDHR